jgi:CHASE3 domain sensor protein
VSHTHQVRQSLADLLSAVLGAETSRQDYDEINKAEEHLLQTRSGAARRSGKRAIAIAVLGGGFSTLVVLFAMAILHRDLAERRRAEEALRRREAELKEAQRVLHQEKVR